MSRFFYIFFTLLLSTNVTFAKVNEGDKIPSFTLNKLGTEEKVSSSIISGKVTLLDFWASWCVPCRFSFKAYEKMYTDGINIVGVNIDKDLSKAQSFLKANPVGFTILFDQGGQVASQFDLPTMPTSYLIDKSGKVIKVYPGFKKGDEAKILEDIKKANA